MKKGLLAAIAGVMCLVAAAAADADQRTKELKESIEKDLNIKLTEEQMMKVCAILTYFMAIQASLFSSAFPCGVTHEVQYYTFFFHCQALFSVA